jgi:hypothetical protein
MLALQALKCSEPLFSYLVARASAPAPHVLTLRRRRERKEQGERKREIDGYMDR